MAVTDSTYYSLTRVREQSPEARDWAATDRDPEIISLLLKAFEQHTHTGTSGLKYPGYDPTTPILPTVTELDGGILGPGTSVGVRLSYINSQGLETDATVEVDHTVGSATTRPLTPQLVSVVQQDGGIGGGTYVYAITKRKGSGETLISDVLTVPIPYDSTYAVNLSFDSIAGTYTDGTDGINIYRSAGLSSNFQLVTTITDVHTSTFTDTNSIPVANAGIQPPNNNTFDATKKIRIDWSTITHPAGASKLRIYVTQQLSLWSTDHLLKEIDLTGPPANYVDYLGNETLSSGWPLTSSQIPSSPPKLNLGTEAMGAPVLTADMDFAGYKANNMRLGTASLSSVGGIWFDSGTNQFKGYGNTGAFVIAGTTGAFVHGATEAGGHVAANIVYGSSNVGTVLNRIVNSSDGTQKQVIVPVKSTATTSGPSLTSTTPTLLQEMTLNITPAFATQWALADFQGYFQLSTAGATATVAIEVDGVTLSNETLGFTAGVNNQNFTLKGTWHFQLSTVVAKTIRILWWATSAATVTNIGLNRTLVAKLVY